MSELLFEDIKIKSILESVSNQENKYQKFNRFDMLVENTKGGLIVIELQNNHERDYLLRMLFGSSKLLVEYLDFGMPYGDIKK